MSDRLDRAEALLEAHGTAIAELATRQVTTQHQIDSLIVAIDRTSAELNNKLDRLANIVEILANRQEDHENRINRLEQ